MNQPKVVYMCPHYAALSEGGSLRSVAIARYLASNNLDISVVCPDTLERSLKKRTSLEFKDGDIKVFCATGHEDYRRSFFTRFFHEIRVAFGAIRVCFNLKPDLIIASYPPAFFPFVALVCRLILPCKVVLEVRDLMAGALKSSGYMKSSFVTWSARLYEAFLVRYSDAVAIVSPGMKEPVRNYDLNAKILRSYNGIEDTTLDFDQYNLEPELASVYNQILDSISYESNDQIFLYAGALTQSYDLDTIIIAFANLQPNGVKAKLLILGDGEKRKQYEEKVRMLGLSNVFFHGFVDRRVALALISLADVGVHAFSSDPHWDYVLGNKVFDYMACGTSVLFSGGGTTAKLVEEANAGFAVKAQSPNLLAIKMQDMLTKSYTEMMGNNAKRFVFDNWRRSQQMDAFMFDLNALGLLPRKE